MTALGRNWVYFIAGLMSLLAITALSLNAYGIYVCYIKNDPPGAFGYFTAALLLSFGAFAVVTAALLVTNTRRPRGIDPDAPLGPVMGFDKATLDAFSITADEVLKHERKRVRAEDLPLDSESKSKQRRRAYDQDDEGVTHRGQEPRAREPHVVIDEYGEPYGRRSYDVPISDIKRTIEAVRSIGGDPRDVLVPDWVREIKETHREQMGEQDDTLDLAPPDESAIESLDVGEQKRLTDEGAS